MGSWAPLEGGGCAPCGSAERGASVALALWSDGKDLAIAEAVNEQRRTLRAKARPAGSRRN